MGRFKNDELMRRFCREMKWLGQNGVGLAIDGNVDSKNGG